MKSDMWQVKMTNIPTIVQQQYLQYKSCSKVNIKVICVNVEIRINWEWINESFQTKAYFV